MIDNHLDLLFEELKNIFESHSKQNRINPPAIIGME